MFFRLLVFMIFVCFSALNTPAWAGTIYEISVSQQGANTQIKVMFDGQATAANKVFLISDAKPRLVMDWTHAGQAIKSAKNVKNTAGIKSMRYAERGQGTRIVFDLEKPLPVLSQKIVRQAFTVTLKGQIDVTPKQRVTNLRIVPNKPRYFKRAKPFPMLKPFDDSRAMIVKSKKRRPIIVIDAGHGGRDPGALGKRGTKEKKITFAAARELKRQLLATGRYDVIMTRNDDSYVEHEERLRIARAGSADLFISIHADSAGKSARGATVYTLADRAKNRSRRVVNSQNWIMDVDLTQQSDPVGDILVDLAQRSTKNASTRFADILLSNLKNSTRLINNSHRRAGYFVLLAPDVPAVLLELGYLSNVDDETLLNKASHRKKMMTSVTTAINSYFKTQKS